MKIPNLALLLLIVLLAVISPAVARAQENYTCMNDFVIKDAPKKTGVRGAVSKPSRKWVPGQEIRVKFLDGNQFVRSKVEQYAEMWEEFANVDFVFVESGPAEIRISFTMDKGSWSFIGKDSMRQSWVKSGDQSVFEPNDSGASMNFGWFNDKTSDQEFRRTTLHEFGHALGLLHEHQNKNQNIEWNYEAVYAYFAKQGWSREKVQQQVLERYGNNTEVTNGVYDRLSIMHYYYPPELIKNGQAFPSNTTLSAGDKAIIAEMYPFDDGDERIAKQPVNKPTMPPVVQPTAPLAPIFSFTDVSVDFEGFDDQTEQDGMIFTSNFQVKNGLKQEFSMVIYFYKADGTPLEDTNKKYYSANGKVAAYKKFVPAYPTAVYKEFKIFMPYEELELEECGEHNLKYSISIWSGSKRAANTGYSYFEMNIPCEE